MSASVPEVPDCSLAYTASTRLCSYTSTSASAMVHIYTSDLPSPPLPRQSIFHHLFPELDGPCAIPASAPQLIDALSGRVVTREQVRLDAQRLAGGLRKLGLKRGDVVGVVGVNSVEWCNAVFGSLAGGYRVSPMNYA
jgi:acyl-CoA synthetase (AMP-forming)/AMP-acid ligase II